MWNVKARSLWGSFAQHATERKTSPARGTPWKTMFGLQSVGWGPERFASSMEYRKLAFSATSWRAPSFLCWESSYLTTDLCRTMVPRILQGQQDSLWSRMISTGGARSPRARLNWEPVAQGQILPNSVAHDREVVDGKKKFLGGENVHWKAHWIHWPSDPDMRWRKRRPNGILASSLHSQRSAKGSFRSHEVNKSHDQHFNMHFCDPHFAATAWFPLVRGEILGTRVDGKSSVRSVEVFVSSPRMERSAELLRNIFVGATDSSAGTGLE